MIGTIIGIIFLVIFLGIGFVAYTALSLPGKIAGGLLGGGVDIIGDVGSGAVDVGGEVIKGAGDVLKDVAKVAENVVKELPIVKGNKNCKREFGKDAFWDAGKCYTCPSGFVRSIGLDSVTSKKACVRFEGKCPNETKVPGDEGQFKDLTQDVCWSCGKGKVRTTGFDAVDSAKGCVGVGGKCPIIPNRGWQGAVADVCYSCPSGYDKADPIAFAKGEQCIWKGNDNCKVQKNRGWQGKVANRCYSCPPGYDKSDPATFGGAFGKDRQCVRKNCKIEGYTVPNLGIRPPKLPSSYKGPLEVTPEQKARNLALYKKQQAARAAAAATAAAKAKAAAAAKAKAAAVAKAKAEQEAKIAKILAAAKAKGVKLPVIPLKPNLKNYTPPFPIPEYTSDQWAHIKKLQKLADEEAAKRRESVIQYNIKADAIAAKLKLTNEKKKLAMQTPGWVGKIGEKCYSCDKGYDKSAIIGDLKNKGCVRFHGLCAPGQTKVGDTCYSCGNAPYSSTYYVFDHGRCFKKSLGTDGRTDNLQMGNVGWSGNDLDNMWSCPKGYHRSGAHIQTNAACTKNVKADTTSRSDSLGLGGLKDVAGNQGWSGVDAIGRASDGPGPYQWKCPVGFGRTLAHIQTNDACGKGTARKAAIYIGRLNRKADRRGNAAVAPGGKTSFLKATNHGSVFRKINDHGSIFHKAADHGSVFSKATNHGSIFSRATNHGSVFRSANFEGNETNAPKKKASVESFRNEVLRGNMQEGFRLRG